MRLVVGLGNPGKRYDGTRHNVGFEVLTELSRRHGAPAPKLRFEAALSEVAIGGERVLLAMPQTFMNLSGRAVRGIIDFYKIPLAELLVISDDLNLLCGQLRLRGSGSAGGQKGLKNIIDQLGTEDFARLRIGIERPKEGSNATDYVLQKFSRSERELIDEAVLKAADGAESWVLRGLEATMNVVNAKLGGKGTKGKE